MATEGKAVDKSEWGNLLAFILFMMTKPAISKPVITPSQ
ncbi:hypothetical protein yberc0001_7800 [Yersinia bercovieri ATCC 43970]|uniref:Uncharacterized protein n=1 Tax=Yersinia bercovieri ATCC 43970 TaxID=349968 RepID=A0ABM9XY36_YERBE|nr:hypothetical protein yberc0001_7800 [Yersinia bercovieri ATCC 43970]